MEKQAMLLIDSLYINTSGGLRLLEYLVHSLISKNIVFFLLADARCTGKFDNCEHVLYMKASLRKRKHFYHSKKTIFSSVLCFGNIPAPIKMAVPVYTYFHNINLLTLSEANSKMEYLLMWIKRQVFRYYKDNTDFWIVQTNNTANELCHHLHESKERIKIIPFYELSDELVNLKYQRHGNDYVYVANYYTGSKGHEELLEAWKILYQEGINKKLHLTIDNSCHFANTVRLAQSEGVQVVNHGSLPFNKITELYRISKAIIYPSHNESFGLGLVEAMEAGCDVIASDLPFVYAICKPSEVFEPTSPQSIADAVIRYEEGKSPKSRQIVENKIDEIISIISSS